jgi:hypothetical protein
MILKPAQPGTTAPQISFKRDGVAQSEIKFPEAAGNIHEPVSIEISNSSRAPLLAPRLALIATDPASKDVFGLAKDLVTGVPELAPNQAGTVSITFAPRAAGTYSGVLSVSASNLTAPATIRVVASASAAPAEKPPVAP